MLGEFGFFVLPGSAFSGDAEKVADYIARSSVRTIYKNLRAEGISWERIRDQHMPAIMSKSLRSIKRDYSRAVILNEFLPTLVKSYYSEIDKINKENSISCVESRFIVATIVPFIQSCESSLGQWQISTTQVVDVVLNIPYPYQVCTVSSGSSCTDTVRDKFSSAFDYDFSSSRFKKVCSDTSWLSNP
ncbi:MAG: hypothetical protein D3923_19285 [Candidatus Electrothrix sp. AR3]|nr:hypothetical protein [Candidatus Electrothrix sp. AR3]